MIVFNPHIKSRYNIPQKTNKISFKAIERDYRLGDEYLGIKMGNFTYLFRSDVDWLKLSKYEYKLFNNKDKVNIIQFASSDGAEAYTQIISLLEAGSIEKAKKFFPIKAYDIDSKIVDIAKSGLMNLEHFELYNFSKNGFNVQKYFKPNEQKFSLNNDVLTISQNTYVAKKLLKENVIFEAGDMFKLVNTIKDDSNTIVLCRNALSYFPSDLQEKFIQSISKRLKEGSLFVIGSLEVDSEVIALLQRYRFKRIMKNVYQKMNNAVKQVLAN